MAQLAEQPSIIVASPTRLVELIRRKAISLQHSLRVLVVDEADLVLSYGYEDDLRYQRLRMASESHHLLFVYTSHVKKIRFSSWSVMYLSCLVLSCLVLSCMSVCLALSVLTTAHSLRSRPISTAAQYACFYAPTVWDAYYIYGHWYRELFTMLPSVKQSFLLSATTSKRSVSAVIVALHNIYTRHRRRLARHK